MSYKSINFPNPVKVCQRLYGPENVNNVRDCVMDSIYRFYGSMCEFHQRNLSKLIEEYLIQILRDAGRNPNAVKLAMSPQHLEPTFFVNRYIESKFDKKKAFELCIRDCKTLRCGSSEACKVNCIIDHDSVLDQ